MLPEQLNDWSEAILDLAGWIVDLALLMENTDLQISNGERWMMDTAVKRYQLAVEKLKVVENYLINK